MNFKEQMQEKADKTYQSYSFHTKQSEDMVVKARLDGAQAALSSDLVKGLVDAGDRILEWFKQDDETGVLNADDVMDVLKAAITNYKQEVKQ